MKPLANFECQKCAESIGDPLITEIVIEDCPVDSKHCPQCGASEGFVRLFDAVNVMGSHTRTLGKVLDDKLKPLYERHATAQDSAKSFERGSAEAMAKAYAQATPAERAQMQPTPPGHVLPAGSVLSSMSPAARSDTRECITPALLNRKVRPQWTK